MFQNIQLIHYTNDVYHKNKVLARSRKALREYGILGLNQVPCLRALLHRLPLLLQEQYLYEKVSERASEQAREGVYIISTTCSQSKPS